MQAAIAAGGLLGAVVAPQMQGRMRLRTLVALISLAGALLLGTAALLILSPLVAVPVAVSLMLAPAANAALMAGMLRRTPEGMRGRASNTMTVVATALAAPAPLLAGLLVQHASGAWAMGAFAATMAVAAALCLILTGLWKTHSPAPAP